jgi:hypothetical protein
MNLQEKREILTKKIKEWMMLKEKAEAWAQSKEGKEFLKNKNQEQSDVPTGAIKKKM